MLVFYVEPGWEATPGVEPVPEEIEFVPAGESSPVRVRTEVVVAQRASPEDGTGGPPAPRN